MKRLTAIILTATTACLMTFISCRKDNDEVKTTFSGFMTGYTDSQGYITVLNDDMGNRYMVNGRTSHYPPDTLVRLVAVISIDENNTASIEDCVLPFSSKAPVDSSLPDSARVSDPLQIQSIYIGGGFLNLHLAIKVQKEGTTHFLAYSRLILSTSSSSSFTIMPTVTDLCTPSMHTYQSRCRIMTLTKTTQSSCHAKAIRKTMTINLSTSES